MKKVTQLVSALRKYDPDRIIIFGSHARGEADEHSDLDIVIIKETKERFLDRLKAVYELVQPTFALDVLVYTPGEFAELRKQGNPFIEMVLKEGVVIYEKPKS